MGPTSEKCDEMPRWPTSWRGDVCCLASSGCALASWPGLPSPAWARPVPGLEPAWVGGPLSDTSCLGWNWLNYSLISGQKWPILTLEVRRVAPSFVLEIAMVALKRLIFSRAQRLIKGKSEHAALSAKLRLASARIPLSGAFLPQQTAVGLGHRFAAAWVRVRAAFGDG